MADNVLLEWHEPESIVAQRNFWVRKFDRRKAMIISNIGLLIHISLIIALLYTKQYWAVLFLFLNFIGDIPSSVPHTYRITSEGIFFREWMVPFKVRWDEIELYRISLPPDAQLPASLEVKFRRKKDWVRWVHIPFDPNTVKPEELKQILEEKLPGKFV